MRLLNCFIPFFAQLRAFAQQPSGDAATAAARLDASIAAVRLAAADAGYGETDVDDALFAAVAWADEVLLTLPWDGAAQWQRQLLQRRYFNVSNAGVAFFARLDQLAAQRLDVREVYCLCLGLGFGGRYAYDRNQKALTDIKRSNFALLLQGDDGLPGEAGQLLFPDGYGTLPEQAAPSARGIWRAWLRPRGRGGRLSFTVGAVLVPVAVLLVLFGVYHLVIALSVGALLPQITV
ncbi:type VI secretion system protein ImpK [Paraburkholderia caballeronis]|uniref:DotU family type IV/VI secretion system protein n=1 Tax=Paraburkholderia caballeronis TaxID=416943 RepID=UPI00106709C8|nr:DotU family type IV/VI secretion system protein [Paraburkholderia caballeronis]TDV28724.1 type VI secretion system protein ImpK [Paraburkholderia caballeronis]